MAKKNNIVSWDNYGLIAELVYKLKDKRSLFSKTDLQNLLFLFQELFGINCGYSFDFRMEGLYCSDLEIDFALVESWGGVKLEPVKYEFNTYGYTITIGENNEAIRAKAKDFLSRAEVKEAIEKLITEFGSLSARELGLLATIVYIVREKKEIVREDLLRMVKSLKPKCSEEEIIQSIEKLQKGHYLILGNSFE